MPPRRLQISRLVYWLAVIFVFGWAAWRRFSLPIIPILDLDSPNFLWPALLKLNGGGFVHTAGLNFIYPGFLFLFLRLFSDFRAIVIVQHLLGLTGAIFFLLAWNRLHDLDEGGSLRRSFHQAIGLFGAAVYLMSPIPTLFEMQIRSEALCLFAQLLSLWLLFEFLYHRQTQADRAALFCGLGAIGGMFLLCSLKPSYILAALLSIGIVLWLVVRGRQTRNHKVLFVAGAFALAVAFFLPERLLSASDPATKLFLPQTLFSIHANIIRDQMQEDLERGAMTPFSQTWLRTASAELGAEINRLRVAPPRQFSVLGFDPDHLMNGDNAIFTKWRQQLGSVEQWQRFLQYYFWRAVRNRPFSFATKICRQAAVFYNWECPAFVAYPKYAFVAWHYAPSLAVIRDPENWAQLGKLPAGLRLATDTEKYCAQETFFQPGKRPIFFQAILARAYLPLLLLSVCAVLLELSRGRHQDGRWLGLLVIFLFLFTFSNVLGVSIVHSMEVLRYSTVQFPATLLAELCAVRYLLAEFIRANPKSIRGLFSFR